MSEKHPIEEIMGVSMDKIREMVDINTIIGEPISSPDGTIIIPVSKESFVFESGGSDHPSQADDKIACGAGAGVTVKPQSFIVIKRDGEVKLLEMGEKASPIESVVDALPDIVEKIKSMLPEKDKDKIRDKKEK